MDLIEAYYQVAQHMREQAQRKADVAEMLFHMADAMSDQRAKEKQPSTSTAPNAENT